MEIEGKKRTPKCIIIIAFVFGLILLTSIMVVFALKISRLSEYDYPNQTEIILYKGQYYTFYFYTDYDTPPDGFNYIGDVTTIEQDLPVDELQMRINTGFDIKGSVFASDVNPDVLYISHLISPNTNQDKGLAMFVSERVGGYRNYYIRFSGKLYKKNFGYVHDPIRHYGYPEGCVEGDVLKFNGDIYMVPVNDGETNWEYTTVVDEDTKILYDPYDSSRIYTYRGKISQRNNMGNETGKIDTYDIWRLIKE